MDIREKDEARGKLESLEERVRLLLSQSQDREFTAYLQNFMQRVIQQKYQTDLLLDELERSLRMYQNKMEQPKSGSYTYVSANQYVSSNQYVPSNQYVSANTVPESAQIEKPKKQMLGGSGEFAVGAVLLSVLGGAFILAALVMAGINYMNGFVRGMSLYAFSALFLLISEIFIYRRWKILGSVLSAVGISGLFLSTVLNYLVLHNFPGWMAVLLTAVIMIFVALLSRKRDSAFYRILGLIACYLCFIPIGVGITDAEFLVVCGMILLTNIVCVFLPVNNCRTGVNILHMLANTVFAQIFIWRAMWCQIAPEPRIIFLLSSLFVLQLLLVTSARRGQKTEGVQAAYGISGVLYLSIFCFEIAMHDRESLFFCWGVLLGIALICLIGFLLLLKHKEKWCIYTFANLTLMILALFLEGVQGPIFWLALLVIAKLLSAFRSVFLLKVNDVILTTAVSLMALAFRSMPAGPEDLLCGNLLLAGVLVSVPFISFFHPYYQILTTYTTAFYLMLLMPAMLKLPIFVGVLFGGILLFNNVSRWRGKNIILFNALALAGQIVCFLCLLWPGYRNAYVTYLCMLVFGLATIVITFHEKYSMNFGNKSMITAVFLTYMALIVRLGPSVVNSILLMLIALVGVAAGFVEKKKSVRIYGLVLSLLVCGKIVLYDFMGAPTLQRTILLFSVGVMALVISGIYIILEKKNALDQNAPKKEEEIPQ